MTKHFKIIVGISNRSNGTAIGWFHRRMLLRSAKAYAALQFGSITVLHGEGLRQEGPDNQIHESVAIFEIGVKSYYGYGSEYKKVDYFCSYLKRLFDQDSVYLVQPGGVGILYEG